MRRWALWAAAALGLHALLFALLRPPVAQRVVRAAQGQERELDIELTELAPVEALESAAAPEAALARAAGVGRTAASSARERSYRPGESAHVQDSAPGATLPPGAAAPAAAQPDAPPLSMAELGLGEGNPFLRSNLARARPAAARAGAPKSVEARFERALAGELLRANHARGLGPEGPVLTALEAVTRASEVPANTAAVLRCKTDAQGRLVSIDVLESSTDPLPWRRVARRVLAALRSQSLRVPPGHAVEFELRVVSRQTLPSGADPGLAVSVLGIPVKKGDGDQSPKVEILNVLPTLSTQQVTLPSGQTAQLPAVTWGSLIAISGDPVDIGAPAQRVVHAHITRLRVDGEAQSTSK